MRPTAIVAGEIEEWEAHDLPAGTTVAWDVGLTVIEDKEAIMVWLALFVDGANTMQISRFANPADLSISGSGRLLIAKMLETLQSEEYS